MPRKPIEQKKLENILTELVFLPTPGQRKIKAKYWSRRAQSQLTNAHPDLPHILTLVKDKRIPTWWQEPGFKEWFRNEEEFKERVQYLADLALDTLEEVMVNPEAKETAKIAAAKLMMELGNKLPKTNEQVFMDEKINAMNPEQLREFIKQSAPRLISVPKSDTIEAEVNSTEGD